MSIARDGPDPTVALNNGNYSRRLRGYSFDSMCGACGKKSSRLKRADRQLAPGRVLWCWVYVLAPYMEGDSGLLSSGPRLAFDS